MTIARYRNTRFWGVWDQDGILVCVCVYKRGAQEVKRRMEEAPWRRTQPTP